MGRLLALCAGILVLAMLVPAAWPQETPTPAVPQAPAAPEDPLANAIAAVKARAAARRTSSRRRAAIWWISAKSRAR